MGLCACTAVNKTLLLARRENVGYYALHVYSLVGLLRVIIGVGVC